MKDEPLPSTLSENRKHRLRANNRNLSQCLAAGNSGDRLVTAFQSYLFSRQFWSMSPFGDCGVVNYKRTCGPQWGGGKIMRIKRRNIGERAKNVRLYSALWAEKGEILPNVQCQARAFRHCVQKLYGGRHECCALGATSKQSREAWWGLTPQSPFGSCAEWAGFTVSLKSKWVGESVLGQREGHGWHWVLRVGTGIKQHFQNRNKTVSAHICLTSEPSNRQDVSRGIVRWRSGHKMAHKVCPFLKHRKNCECCPGHYPIVNHSPPMSWFKFRNFSIIVNFVTNSLNCSKSKSLSLSL